MQCDMCGYEGHLFKVEIEGTVLNVCKNCSRFGKVIVEPKLPKKLFFKKNKAPETEFKVVSSYSSLIRKAREKIGLTQEQFAKKINEKESLVNHMEAGKFSPSLSLAKKLEKILNISLLEEDSENKVESSKYAKSGPLTIGDMIKTRKK